MLIVDVHGAGTGLLGFVRRRSYDVFVVYRVVVGITALLLIATGALDATF